MVTEPPPPSRTDFERFIESAPLLAWVSDEHGRMVYVNAHVRAFLGPHRPFVPGTPILETYPPAVAATYLASDRRVLETGEPFEGREPGVGLDGEPTVLLVRKFLLDAPGGARLIGGFAVDITAETEHERKLRLAEDRFSRMIARAREGVWLVDDQWRTTFVNPAIERMLGFTSAEMQGRTVLDFVPDGERDAVLARMRARESGLEEDVEAPLRRKDGTVCWTQSSTHPLLDERERFVGAFALVTDVTARRKAAEAEATMEATLRETQRLEALGVLAGGIAHDFNNLLAGVLANIDLVALDLPDDAVPARESLQLARDAARRAATLTRQLLAYAGKNRLAVRATDLVGVVRATYDILGKGRVRVELALSDAPPVVADESELGQAVLAIVMNAVESLPAGPGTARVSTGVRGVDRAFLSECVVGAALSDGRYTFLVVEDDGPGMTPDVAARAFEPFFTTKGIGRGLGLSATLGIVRGHGGALHVRTAPGAGTTVTLLMPIAPEEEDLVAPSAPPEVGKPKLLRATVLLVDDDDGVRRAARRLLEARGYRALEADGGRQAVATYTRSRAEIDAVLLDLRMPDMDGEETLRSLLDIDPAVRVVLWSGYAEPDLVNRLTASGGVVGFVPKPFEASALLEAVARAADGAP